MDIGLFNEKVTFQKNTVITDSIGNHKNGSEDLRGYLKQLAESSVQLSDGSSKLAQGLTDAGDGAKKIAQGTNELADGTVKLHEGAGELQEGATKLEQGVSQYTNAVGQIAEQQQIITENQAFKTSTIRGGSQFSNSIYTHPWIIKILSIDI